jgi:diguanylate cyclase (GGDEF)-like protein
MRLTVKGNPEVESPHPVPSIRSVGAWAALAAGLLLVFLLDQATGSAPVQHLYYLPIIFAAVRFGFPGGIAAPLAAIVLYHVANPRLLAFAHEHWDMVQIGLFLAVGLFTAKLTDDKRRLHTLASTDDLTGLHNLRSFERHLAAMVRACRHASVPLAVLVLDVDRLKSLNDTHGHLAGAEAVRTVGRIIASRAPPDSVACRYGGDEFVIALPRCTEVGGRAFADGLRHAVYATAPVLTRLPFRAGTLSISVGVACELFTSHAERLDDTGLGEELFRAADRALYQAKQLGRNHVCVA